MVPRPRSTRLISSCDLSAFGLIMTFVVFAVLTVVMTSQGTIPGHWEPLLPRVHHLKVVGYHAWGANRSDAMVAVVARDGRIYFGAEQVLPADLPSKIQQRLSSGSERRVYIKADARAPYAAVKQVLEAMQSAGVEQVTILADESVASKPR